MPRRHPYWSRKILAVSPSAAVSAESGSESASSRTLRQCRSDWRRVAGPGPRRGARVPARRLERLAGGLPVLGQQRRALVEPLRVLLGDRPRHRGVDGGAPLAELRAVGHLLGQRVLERVQRLGVELLLVDELARDQLAKRLLELRRLQLDDPRRAPARGTPCRSPPPPGAPPSRAAPAGRCAPRAPPARSPARASSSTGPHEPVGAALALEAARLDQRLHHLLDEERVARACARGSAPAARRARGRSRAGRRSSSSIASGPSGARAIWR